MKKWQKNPALFFFECKDNCKKQIINKFFPKNLPDERQRRDKKNPPFSEWILVT